jgi:hypothetical protein
MSYNYRPGQIYDTDKKRLVPRRLTGESHSGWRNWDTWNFNLLVLNDEKAYRRMQAFRDNFERKIKRGDFDREKAKYALRKYLGEEVKRLEKEYNAGPDQRVNLNNVDYDEILDAVLEK